MTIDLENITIISDSSATNRIEIKRCLETLYQTPEGTCPLDRDFGIRTDFVGMPMDVAKNLLAMELIEKTTRYEPRVTIQAIHFSIDAKNGQLKVEVVFTYG